MATHRSGHRPAGGVHSKQTVHRPLPKTAKPTTHSIDPGAVSQIGISSFLGRDELRDGRGYSTPKGPTDSVAAVGVGGGRTIYKSGSQHGMGPAKPMPEGRDTLAEYGPESITSKQR
jgi:hypothetical protein